MPILRATAMMGSPLATSRSTSARAGGPVKFGGILSFGALGLVHGTRS
ncbi:hypothetical protein [Spirosoma flavum]